MPKEFKEPLLNHWYRALSTPFGVELACSYAESVVAELYTARKSAHDPDLDAIKVVPSPFDPTRVWLVRKEPAT